MVTDEEMRAYYEKQKEYDIQTGSKRPVSSTFEEFQGRGAAPKKKPKEPKPAAPAPAPSPPPPKQSLGGRLLSGAKDFLTSDWMAHGSARVQGRAPPRRRGRQSETMAWLGRASENISRMDMNFVPPGMMMGPEAPEPKRRSRKKKGRRAPPIEEEVRPWDMNYVPPHLRRFF